MSGFEKARRELLDAGRNLWWAGLGAVAGVEDGSRSWFDRMVERGRPIEKRQRQTIDELSGRTATTVREMSQLFQDTVDYETRKVLKRLGVMTREDVTVLAARIDTLAKRIDELAALRETAQNF
ncbi:MAG TPA: phasin family protein [Thermoanaerobaculia bacterium]